MKPILAIVGLLGAAAPAVPAAAWNAQGHRLVTDAALDLWGSAAPDWLRTEMARSQVGYQSSEVDRWRGTQLPALGHVNKPDHSIDVERLPAFGLTLETVSPFRYEYVRAMAVAKALHPGSAPSYDPSTDADRSREWPGFLPHSIAESSARLRSSFHTLRILDALGEAVRGEALAAARANIAYHMGALGHFVGDASQPLHTTLHSNGWAGENPEGYTTDRGFHEFVDGALVDRHAPTVEAIVEKARSRANSIDPLAWPAGLALIRRSFDRVEDLYRLDKSGRLVEAEGRAFLLDRLADSASVLAALCGKAYETSAPTAEEIRRFAQLDNGVNVLKKGAAPFVR